MGTLPAVRNPLTSSEKLIIIGASTGGTEAIKEFLMQMPSDCPGMLIAQHMPEGFTRRSRSASTAVPDQRVESAGERASPGHAYIAPGDAHLMLVRDGANYVTKIDPDPVNRHRPSVDVLFRSVATAPARTPSASS